MIELTSGEFDNQIRGLRNVAIKSFVVGSARLTSYYRGKNVVGMIRECKGIKTFYINKGY